MIEILQLFLGLVWKRAKALIMPIPIGGGRYPTQKTFYQEFAYGLSIIQQKQMLIEDMLMWNRALSNRLGKIYDLDRRELHELAILIYWLIRIFNGLPPQTVKHLRHVTTGEEFMGTDYMIYRIVLPTPHKPNDIVSTEVSISIDGGDPEYYVVPVATRFIEDLRAPQDSIVHIEAVYIDDSGNRSLFPSVYEFVALDTIPPPNPGDMGAEIVGEINEDDPGPDPSPGI